MSDAWPLLLREAIDEGDADALARTLERHPAAANARIEWGDDGKNASPALVYLINAPFHGRCPGGRQAQLARQLVAAGADVDWDPTRDPRGETPLMTAVSLYEEEIVDLLLQAGADLERRGGCVDEGTALDLGVHFSAAAAVDRLVRAGARTRDAAREAGAGCLDRLQRRSTESLHLPRVLQYAAINERVEVLDYLFEAGVDAQAECEGATALHWAAWWGRPRSLARLLGAGADPRRPDRQHGGTARQWAVFRRDAMNWPFPEPLTAAISLLDRWPMDA